MITILISTASWRIPLRKHRFSTMLSSENHFQAPLSPETFRHSPTSWRLPWALASWPCPVPSHTRDMWMAPFSRWSLDRWPSTACTFWWVFGGSHIEISLLTYIYLIYRSNACTYCASGSGFPTSAFRRPWIWDSNKVHPGCVVWHPLPCKWSNSAKQLLSITSLYILINFLSAF